jgi:penicillin-binding protein 1A
MDPHTGYVKAWVGGINHRYFQYDHVNKHTRRQVGSTFKPIVYAAALQQGADPCTYISAEQVTYPDMDNWSPGNADGNYDGEYTLEGGLINSVNTVSVKILKRTGLTNTISLAKAMGIENEIPKLPSIALGTPELSLSEMVAAYTTFANRGRPVKPVYLQLIADRHGKVLQQWTSNEPMRLALEPDKADLMVHMLQSVVNEGTGSRLRWKYKLPNEIAGKTGTTQSHADGWFIGMTPNLVAGAWVGADDPGIRFRSTSLGQGANTALPIFGLFMQKVNSDTAFTSISKARFNLNNNLIASMDCEPYREPLDMDLFDKIFGGGNNDRDGNGNSREPERKNKEDRKKRNKSIFDRIFGN